MDRGPAATLLDVVDTRESPRVSWSSGMGSICDDTRLCLQGCFCTSCLFGSNYAALRDTGCWGPCCLYFWCRCMVCMFASDVRHEIRAKYNLRPEPCNDLVTHLFCSPCALCQEAREVRYQERRQAYTG
ncbi:hypothetical protein HYH03_012316 [Edaphochlamys debaryana]|uniref:Uncharacterized protein n=1 Tax=Edaphochlamys debaryana TaxID=47281 RepID=A0A835XSX0_9CHLO|nr:hypothetical protein HYH03_012316 [Edaphochlamys debaryana]|eukprot:KAG2489090.1 hypothetical protein HYH03_012316 [Edaphochlamys debaryana]